MNDIHHDMLAEFIVYTTRILFIYFKHQLWTVFSLYSPLHLIQTIILPSTLDSGTSPIVF